ncbi:MAG: sigma-70 family RNA polymerase sigma factor [Prevotellaceae bacterium]|jgi:RNA polymerase sigma-70 factor (ECF subfamily)|nr:sigma-70 family RNA polymerase sigma factor [Prevotellaceae bacterium]
MKLSSNAADETLVALYAQGNDRAFDVLLNRHRERIYSYIYYAVRNGDQAADILQETLTKAITAIRQGRYQESNKFSSWLLCIAHNLLMDFFRKVRVENAVSADSFEYSIFNDARFADYTVETEMALYQIHCDVRRLVRHLPDDQREVVNMRFYRNLSFKEIAAKTGVSVNTSLGRMRYALINMRRMARKYDIALSVD